MFFLFKPDSNPIPNLFWAWAWATVASANPVSAYLRVGAGPFHNRKRKAVKLDKGLLICTGGLRFQGAGEVLFSGDIDVFLRTLNKEENQNAFVVFLLEEVREKKKKKKRKEEEEKRWMWMR